MDSDEGEKWRWCRRKGPMEKSAKRKEEGELATKVKYVVKENEEQERLKKEEKLI